MRDVSLDKKDPVKFWKSSACETDMGIIWRILQHCQI